jgi:tRNA 5-methylaminomethyl-2-thiouridine biosynthesis bifunctional protein
MTEDDASLDWVDRAPRSRRFDDVYFSGDGLAESRAVFLAGAGLPGAWTPPGGPNPFVVAELGFGTGLNILALLELWRRTRPPGGRLRVFTVERYPLSRDEARRALAAWPEQADLAELLLAAWPSVRPGFHRIDLPGLDATIDLAVADVEAALAAWDGRANAWFLDGFAPSKNPRMWTQTVFDLIAARSAPGARAATFTVAGAVRRGLAEAGFEVAKAPGFGRKKERLEAVAPGHAPAPGPAPRVAIVGAGVAGAALARAFRALGCEPVVVDSTGPGAGASGNPSALVSPRLDAGGGRVAALHAQSLDRAAALYRADVPDAILAEGVIQLEGAPRDAARFDRIKAWDGFAPGVVARRSAPAVAEALGETPGPGGLAIRDALTLAPDKVLARWLGEVIRAEATGLERRGQAWRLIGTDIEAEIVCLCAGPHTASLAAVGPLRAVRGQASWAAAASGPAAAWGGYAIPAPGGVLFGATHDRDDWDVEPRDEDDARNLALLGQARPRLAADVAGLVLGRRASLRAATPDHMPLAGAIPGSPGLFVLTGLGGRGFTLAPLLAEQLAAQALDAPRPLPRDLAALVDPGRFPSPPGGAEEA